MCGLPSHLRPPCVDLLHTCTLHVRTYSTHAPSERDHLHTYPLCVDYLLTRPFFVCRSTSDVGMKFGRFGLHVDGMLTEFGTNLGCVYVIRTNFAQN